MFHVDGLDWQCGWLCILGEWQDLGAEEAVEG